jgi:hypothetical protein
LPSTKKAHATPSEPCDGTSSAKAKIVSCSTSPNAAA